MSSLSVVLGHDIIATSIGRTLDVGTDISVIQGPPGAGKSWLAKGLGALWQEGGGRTLVAEGDQLQSDAPFYALNLALAALGRRWASIAADLAQVTSAAEKTIGTAGIVTGTAQTLGRLRPARQRAKKLYLSEVEQGILFELDRLAHKRPLLIIADNLHWWDSKSLEFLGLLREPRMSQAFSFLLNLRVIATQTTEPYQRAAHPDSRDALLSRGATRYHDLKRPSRESFPAVLEALGAPAGTPMTTADLVYDFTGGHLALAARCAARLRDGEGEAILSAATDEEFIQRLLTDRIRSLGSVGASAVAVLQIAAVLGLRFRRTEVICALGGEAAEAARVLRTCRDEDILELSEDMGQFAHDLFRQHFLSAGRLEATGIHDAVSKCLSLLRPGAYELRSAHAHQAERHRDAATFGVQAALELQREGQPWRSLAPRTLGAIEEGGMTTIVELFATALGQFHRSDFYECNHTLDALPRALPRALNAEADYLRAIALADTRSIVDREAAITLLEQWQGYEAEEPELGVRLMHVRLFALSLRVDKAPGRALEGQIRQALLNRADFDRSAQDALYVLDRCAGSLYEPDVAVIRAGEATQHFGPGVGQTVLRRPGEYFRCLVNLGAELLINARYSEARQVQALLDGLVADYAPGSFPRLDWPLTNGVLADFRTGSIDLGETLRRQRAVVTEHRVPADPYYVENALAVYLALAGEGDEAIATFDRLLSQLDNLQRPEISTLYLISANRCATRYVMGEREAAHDDWVRLADLVKEIPYVTQKYHAARHSLLEEVMRRGQAMSPTAFDECLLGLNRFGPLWDQVGRGFRLPEIEWWH